jgi:hypothetical protein
MKYYKRSVTKRGSINSSGKLGYFTSNEFVKTNNIDSFNKGKRIPFCESIEAKRRLLHEPKDLVVADDVKPSSSEAHFRKSVSKYRW